MPISQITGASIQDGSIVVADLGITTFNTGTGNTLTLQANSATGLVISVTGNTAIANSLSFSSTGARITGDFSTSTLVNRVAFQTSTANGATTVAAIPNGTGVTGQLQVYNNSDLTNSSRGSLLTNNAETRLTSDITGTGTYLPMTFQTGGSERMRIDTSGNVGIGTTTPTSKLGVFVAPGASGSSGLAVTDGTRNLLVQITGSSYSYNGVGSNENLIYAGSNPLSFLADGQSIKFCAGTTERMRILSTGNIGIGTTSPSQLLHVSGGTILASNTSSTTATVSIAGNGSTTGTSDFALQQGTSSEAYVFNRANSYLVLGTNNTERMRITSGGNVGIGTNNPTNRLHISGGGSGAAGALRFSDEGGSNYWEIGRDNNVNGSFRWFLNGTERMQIDTSGNVGIGTTPQSNFRLSVNSSSGNFIGYFINTNIGTDAKGINVTGYADNGGTKYDWSTGATLYLSNDRYQTSGIVSKIVMNTANGGYNNGAIIHVEGAGAYNQGQLVFSTGWNASNLATERMRIDSSGNLLVGLTAFSGNTSGASGRISVNFTGGQYGLRIFNGTGSNANPVQFSNGTGGETGTIFVTSTTTTYNTSSDYRLKENVAPMTGALAKVALLKPCTYTWKSTGDDGQGFIAHELQEVVPDAVCGEKDAVDADGNIKPQGIDTSVLVATLTAAIQEQQAIIEELKSRIEILEQK